jgi:S-(hydroxymethyl)glutathione dehydrogenase / alcohol dehydrogenase
MLDLDTIIAKRVPLTAINEAFDDLRTGDSVRTVVVF